MYHPSKKASAEISFKPVLSNDKMKLRSAVTASLFVISGIFFTFGLLDCVRYNEDFVISRFCSIHCTVILAGLNK